MRLVIVSHIRYKVPMIPFRFASSKYETIRAFTWDATGGNLPPDYGPWRSLDAGDGVGHGAVSPRVAALVKSAGYFLLSGCGSQSGRQSDAKQETGAPIGDRCRRAVDSSRAAPAC